MDIPPEFRPTPDHSDRPDGFGPCVFDGSHGDCIARNLKGGPSEMWTDRGKTGDWQPLGPVAVDPRPSSAGTEPAPPPEPPKPGHVMDATDLAEGMIISIPQGPDGEHVLHKIEHANHRTRTYTTRPLTEEEIAARGN